MPRFVAGGPGKRKVWHAWVDGSELVVRFGKMGTSLEEQRKSFASREAADKELAKLIKQKTAKGYEEDAFHLELPSGLGVVELVDLPLPVPPTVEAGGCTWNEPFWHGDYALGTDEKDGAEIAGVLDQSGDAYVFRHVTPEIADDDLGYGFDDARARMIVATTKGDAYIVDCKTARAERVSSGGGAPLSVALGRDYFAILRKHSLEITVSGKKQVIACGRENVLFGFGEGRGLMLTWKKQDDSWDGKSWPSTHFLGIDGRVRLLGTFGHDFGYGYCLGARSFYEHPATGLIEIRGLDEALKKTASDASPTQLA